MNSDTWSITHKFLTDHQKCRLMGVSKELYYMGLPVKNKIMTTASKVVSDVLYGYSLKKSDKIDFCNGYQQSMKTITKHFKEKYSTQFCTDIEPYEEELFYNMEICMSNCIYCKSIEAFRLILLACCNYVNVVHNVFRFADRVTAEWLLKIICQRVKVLKKRVPVNKIQFKISLIELIFASACSNPDGELAIKIYNEYELSLTKRIIKNIDHIRSINICFWIVEVLDNQNLLDNKHIFKIKELFVRMPHKSSEHYCFDCLGYCKKNCKYYSMHYGDKNIITKLVEKLNKFKC